MSSSVLAGPCARRARHLGAVAVCVCLAAVAAHGHAFAPSLLALHESARDDVAVTWKTPRLRVRGADVRPVLPAACRERTAPVSEESETAITLRWRIDCGAMGLIGRHIGIAGLAAANSNGLIRVTLADGRLIQQVVTGTTPSLLIPAPPRRRDVWRDYTRAGAWHMLSRLDRWLFVLGLLLLAPAPSLMARTLIAFTLGHSVTLSAATLGLLTVPARAIEIVLALTILALATELAREPAQTWMRRRPWVMGATFGLLHGLGFAAALHTIGVPTGMVSLAAFAFNLGIELGQLSIVALVLVAGRCVRLLPFPLPAWVRQVPVYVMGSLAVFWCLERATAALG